MRWSFDVLKTTSQQAKFEQFVKFFRNASEANSLFGKAVYSPVNYINCSQAKKVTVCGTIRNEKNVVEAKKECRLYKKD